MKDFIAGIDEINVIVYLIYVCTGLAPLFHILIIGSQRVREFSHLCDVKVTAQTMA